MLRGRQSTGLLRTVACCGLLTLAGWSHAQDDRPAPTTESKPLATFGLPQVVGETEDLSKDSTLPFTTARDAKPIFELRGRLDIDAILVNQSDRNRAIIGDVPNATGFRRAYLGVQGTVGEQVNWVAEFDFTGGVITFKDVFIGLNELPIVRRARVGHFLEPFSLEEQTSSNVFALVEYSPIVAIGPGRNWGVEMMTYTDDERATCQIGAFRSGTSDQSGDDIGTSNDMAYDIRITGLPWYDADGRYLLHLGGAFSQRYPFNQVVTINPAPRSNLLTNSDNPGSAFAPAISVPASQQQLYNLQSALVLGPLSFQAEWSATNIDQIGGGPVFLHGSYVFVSYFLTGENREYLTKDGTFGMPHVRSPFLWLKGTRPLAGGTGAWELVARFAYANFASGNIPPQNGLKVGDRDAEFTLGVNWYLNDYMRIMFNYVHALPVDPNFGPSYANAYFIRTAIFW